MAKPNASPDTEILDRLHRLMHGLRRHLHEASREDPQALAPMEARCLAYFVRHPGHTQSELALHAGRDKAQITRIVKVLHERGLLHSTPDALDGRRQHISATAAGRAAQQATRQQLLRYEKRLTADLSPAERATLIALLDRLEAPLQR